MWKFFKVKYLTDLQTTLLLVSRKLSGFRTTNEQLEAWLVRARLVIEPSSRFLGSFTKQAEKTIQSSARFYGLGSLIESRLVNKSGLACL